MLAEIVSIIVQIAPFVSIITIELFSPGFMNRWKATFQRYEENMFVDDRQKKEFKHLTQHVYDHDNTLQHFDLTLLALVIIFCARITQTAGSQEAPVLAGVFLATSLIVFAARWRVESYFKQQSPDKYFTENNNYLGFRYGTVRVVGSNILIVMVILLVELVAVDLSISVP